MQKPKKPVLPNDTSLEEDLQHIRILAQMADDTTTRTVKVQKEYAKACRAFLVKWKEVR